MNLTSAAELLRPVFPKACKAALSLAMRPEETGVTLTPKAKRILFGAPAPRSKPRRMSVRLTEEQYLMVKDEMRKIGCETEQDYLSYLLDTVTYKTEYPSPEDEGYPVRKGG